MLQEFALVMVVIVTTLIAVYALNVWFLTALSIYGRRRILGLPSNKLVSWPMVSIHLPLYNESRVAGRLLAACMAMDYPRDKLEITVVDDSTDETTKIAREFESRYPSTVHVIHRDERVGFKAGALKNAMEHSSGEFIALFDADYVPPVDFLKKMIPYIYLDEKIGFVQSRWSYLDGQFSWIAKAISLAIDIYAFVDQRARYTGKLLAHFSGTCGVFRRRAIEEVGGWSADTLAEDLDLSIRLHLKGWKYIYVPTVVCPGEIPTSFENLRHQQSRWAKGFSECLRKHGAAIVRSKELNLLQKFEAMLHLATYFICPLTILGIFCGILYYTTFPPSFWALDFWKYQIALLLFLMSVVIYGAPLVASTLTVSEVPRLQVAKFRRITHLGYLGAILYGLLISNTRATIDGLSSRASYFYRTPKVGMGQPG
ncbi:MAG TPA: glycosyltransferase [Candidatus Acidoferrum sp.]|nr:glycosyltransferase [Candidatus Acidoferrum sp.]